MAYVQRDEAGAIIGLYTNFQEGFAEEYLEDDDPEVVAFRTPKTEILNEEPQRTACALSVVVQNEEVTAVAGSFHVAGMIFLSEGTFLAVFSHNLGMIAPFVVPNNGVSVSLAEWGADYAVIEIRDHAGGTLVTPASFGFSLYNF